MSDNGWHMQYSCCNEDAQTELDALDLPERRAVAIAGAGGRTFSLLLGDPQQVTGVDINPVQIHLCWLKYHAIRALDRQAYLAFIGIAPSDDRAETYRSFCRHLPADVRAYWDSRTALVESGLFGAGRYERSVLMLAWVFRVARGKMITRLRACGNLKTQAHLVSSRLWTLGWQALFALLFNPVAGRFVIKDKSFYGRPRRRASTYLVDRLNTYLKSNLVRDSFTLELYWTGRLTDEGPLPLHLLEGNYQMVRQRLDRLSFVCNDITHYLAKHRPRSFDAFSLSDLGSYLNPHGLSRALEEVERTGSNGATFCMREFLCQPRLLADWPRSMPRNHDLEERLERLDSSIGYTFICGEVAR